MQYCYLQYFHAMDRDPFFSISTFCITFFWPRNYFCSTFFSLKATCKKESLCQIYCTLLYRKIIFIVYSSSLRNWGQPWYDAPWSWKSSRPCSKANNGSLVVFGVWTPDWASVATGPHSFNKGGGVTCLSRFSCTNKKFCSFKSL